MIYRVVDMKSKRELDDERVISIKEDPLRMEFFHRHKSDGYRAYWRAPVKVVENMITEVVALAKKLELNNDTKIGLGLHSDVIKGVSHDALWKSMVEAVRQPERFLSGLTVDSCKNVDTYVQRTVTNSKGTTVTENIYVYESACEIVYRPLDKWGKE